MANGKGGPGSYWASMTEEERSAEMQRRVAKRQANKAGKPRKAAKPRRARSEPSVPARRFINAKREDHGSGQATESQVAFALGHTQAWLEQYARGIGVPEQSLTFTVADLLRRSAIRKA